MGKRVMEDGVTGDVEALRRRLRTLDFEILVAEVAEEQLMREIEATGRVAPRRPDARLAIVLAPSDALGFGVAA